jgi:hypothetical protein
MKVNATAAIWILLSTTVFAQERKLDNLSLGANYGIHGSVSEVNSIQAYSSNAIRVHASYMFKPTIGVMLTTGFYAYTTKNNTSQSTKFMNGTAEVVYVLSNLFDLKTKQFNFLVHAGPGVSTMWNKNFNFGNATDPYFKNQDDIITLNFGLTPQVILSDNWNVNLDLSYAYHLKQDRAFDFTLNDKKTALVYNLTLGLVYQFHKKQQTTTNGSLEE